MSQYSSTTSQPMRRKICGATAWICPGIVGGVSRNAISVPAKSDAAPKFPKGGKKPGVNVGLPVDASGQMAD
jgi:hypothetical protein